MTGSRPPRTAAAALAAVLALAAAAPSPGRAAEPPRPAAPPAESAPAARAALDRLKALAGEWEGTVHAPDGPPARVRWEVISGGTAVMETLFPGTEHEMRSVYHLDGKELVMTHYCAAGNQPRMRLASGAAAGELVFEFAGGTNLDPAKDGHVHSGVIAPGGPDRLEERWAFFKDGKQAGAHLFFLSRKR